MLGIDRLRLKPFTKCERSLNAMLTVPTLDSLSKHGNILRADQVYILGGDYGNGTVEWIDVQALDDSDATGWQLHDKRLDWPVGWEHATFSVAFARPMRKDENVSSTSSLLVCSRNSSLH